MRVVVVMLVCLGCAEERARPEPGVTGRIHPRGILELTSDNFHGKELARRDYDLALCASCHGDDFGGGAANVSCLDCHDSGPTACSTCHDEDSDGEAHAIHRTRGVACAECHPMPARWDSEGHIRRGGNADEPPAEVVFGARAGAASFADGACANVYCHGATLSGGTMTAPRWDAPVTGSCDRCHGAPPPSHAQSVCATCHPPGAPHIDGTIQVGRTAGCDGCHGRDGNPAPPDDLGGNELTTAIGVGAHQAHLTGPSGLRAPLACTECHAVPTTIADAGHIDTALPAEVLPAVGWSRVTGTCGTWCHGVASPPWTSHGEATCGSCHPVPPPSHSGTTIMQACVNCHPSAAHMDGDVDVF